MSKHDTKLAKTWLVLLVGCFIFLGLVSPSAGEQLIVVEKEYFWKSSNLDRISADDLQGLRVQKGNHSTAALPLGNMAYNTHFESFGAPPPLRFLHPLTKGDSPLACMDGRGIVFEKTGKVVPLNTSIVPSWADPAKPYLLSTPDADWVLVVYPYYVLQCKENEYFTVAYSGSGTHLFTFNSLPTHVSVQNPQVLISPERSGCCDSVKWDIRFYDLRNGSVSSYSCPEGFCGEVLFTKLGESGPYLIVQEIVGAIGGVGGTLQTNIYVIEQNGALSASGKIIYAVREPEVRKETVSDLCPFSISKLVCIEPFPDRKGCFIDFEGEAGAFRLEGQLSEGTPAVFFLLEKTQSFESRGVSVRMNQSALGSPPLVGLADPGNYEFSIDGADAKVNTIDVHLKADTINSIVF